MVVGGNAAPPVHSIRYRYTAFTQPQVLLRTGVAPGQKLKN